MQESEGLSAAEIKLSVGAHLRRRVSLLAEKVGGAATTRGPASPKELAAALFPQPSERLATLVQSPKSPLDLVPEQEQEEAEAVSSSLSSIVVTAKRSSLPSQVHLRGSEGSNGLTLQPRRSGSPAKLLRLATQQEATE